MIRRLLSWKKGLFTIAVALGVSVPWGTDADAHLRFLKLKGGLTTVQVDCPTLCTEGPLTGGLAGKLEFTMASMSETDIPDVATYQGVNVITTSQGTLTGTDYGVWNLATGEFVDYTHFTSGTGIYAGVRGSLVIAGTFDPVGGTGSSRYTAILTLH